MPPYNKPASANSSDNSGRQQFAADAAELAQTSETRGVAGDFNVALHRLGPADQRLVVFLTRTTGNLDLTQAKAFLTLVNRLFSLAMLRPDTRGVA